MFKNIIILFCSAFFFISCNLTSPSIAKKEISPSVKTFPEEDTYIILALDAQLHKDFSSAAKLFDLLYEKSGKKEYLYKSLESSLYARKNLYVLKRIDKITQGSLSDTHLVRLKVVALAESHRVFEASTLALKLLKLEKTEENYLLVANLYGQEQEYTLALKYLESGYNKGDSEEILNKMAIILYSNLHRTKDAIALLETHISQHGCSNLICDRLLGIYSNENNINGLLSTYLKLYKFKPTQEMAKKIIQIYEYKKDANSLIKFLKESGADDEKLLQLYAYTGKYKEAYPLAYNLYLEKGEVGFLGKSAMYEYNAAGKNTSKKLLNNVVEKLQRVIKSDANPLYLNTLGYLLIDHEIDVQKGIKLVKEALKAQPDSVYYIDSLAWGYYKEGRCVQAKKLMQKIHSSVVGNKELQEHDEHIKKCKIQNKGRK